MVQMFSHITYRTPTVIVKKPGNPHPWRNSNARFFRRKDPAVKAQKQAEINAFFEGLKSAPIIVPPPAN